MEEEEKIFYNQMQKFLEEHEEEMQAYVDNHQREYNKDMFYQFMLGFVGGIAAAGIFIQYYFY